MVDARWGEYQRVWYMKVNELLKSSRMVLGEGEDTFAGMRCGAPRHLKIYFSQGGHHAGVAAGITLLGTLAKYGDDTLLGSKINYLTTSAPPAFILTTF